jgi:hypothetical protein
VPSLLCFFENALSELTLAAKQRLRRTARADLKNRALALLERIQLDQVDQLEIIGQRRGRIFIALCFVGMS